MKDTVVFIEQSHSWTVKYRRELGYKVVDSYINHGLLFRIIRELFFRLRLPGKRLFYNKEVLQYKNRTLIVYDSLITHDYIKWLHYSCPSCKILLVYENPVNIHISPDGFLDEWCEKWTSDKDDAKKYNMNLYEGGGYFPQWKVKKGEQEFDVFYIGRDKGRLDALRKIEKEMNDLGIRTMFYITWERGWQKKDDGIHKPIIPYEEVLNYVGKSKAILYLADGAQKGITIRIEESLIHRVKLITDDVSIKDYDFYDPNNIFILGMNDMLDLKGFLDTPYKDVESNFFCHAYFDQAIEEMITRSRA